MQNAKYKYYLLPFNSTRNIIQRRINDASSNLCMFLFFFLPRNILEIKCPIANFYNISCRQRIFNGGRHVFHQIARYYYYSSASFPVDDKNANAFVHAVVRHYFQCRSCHRWNHSINCPFDWHVLSKRHATLRCFKF